MSNRAPDGQDLATKAELHRAGEPGDPLQESPLARLMRGDINPPKLRKEFEKGSLDGFHAQRFEPGDLNGVSYAFAYLSGYARRVGCVVNWSALFQDRDPLGCAIAGD